jgi:hypothetical protein
MNSPDQDTLLRAIEDARMILAEYVEPRLPAIPCAQSIGRWLSWTMKTWCMHLTA